MISKRELIIRIVDLEMQAIEYEEDIRELQLRVDKLETKGKKRTLKKPTTKKGKK